MQLKILVIVKNQILVVDPCDYQLHYNFGFMYQRVNKLESSIYHYKLSLGIIDLLIRCTNDEGALAGLRQFKIKCFLGALVIFIAQEQSNRQAVNNKKINV